MLSTRVVRITLLLGIVLTVHILNVSAAPILSIEPPSQGVRPGQNVSLDVHITGVTDLYAFQFDLAFNPAVLSAVRITEGLPTCAHGGSRGCGRKRIGGPCLQ
jgi:general secretion pathway protein D